MKRTTEKIALAAVCIVALVLGVHAVLSSITVRGAEESETRLRETVSEALGQPLPPPGTWDSDQWEVQPEEPAPSVEPGAESQDDLMQRWQRLLDGVRPVLFNGRPKEEPAREAWGLVMHLHSRYKTPDDLSRDEWGTINAFLAENAALIAEALLLTEHKTKATLQRLILTEEPFDNGLWCHYYGDLYRLTTLLGASALADMHSEEYERAGQKLLAGLRIEQAMRLRYLDPMDSLLAVATDAFFLEARDGGAVPLDLAQRVADAMDAATVREAFAEEVAWLGRQHVRVMEYVPWNLFSGEGFFHDSLATGYANVAYPVVQRDAKLYNDAMADLIEIAPAPYHAAP